MAGKDSPPKRVGRKGEWGNGEATRRTEGCYYFQRSGGAFLSGDGRCHGVFDRDGDVPPSLCQKEDARIIEGLCGTSRPKQWPLQSYKRGGSQMTDSCSSVSKLLEKYFDREVTDRERLLVEGNLQGCPACRDALTSMKGLRTFIKPPVE